jgi:hypothetical protein
MHFGIQIDGRFVDLDERYGITVTLINPAYDQESVDRRYSYGAKMQNTQKTKAILAHADRLDVKGKASYECTFYLQGIPFDRGLIYLDVTTQEHINFHYASGSIDLIQRMKDQKPVAKYIDGQETVRGLDVIQLPYINEGIKKYEILFPGGAEGKWIITINKKDYVYVNPFPGNENGILVGLAILINADYPGFVTVDGLIMTFATLTYDVEISTPNEALFNINGIPSLPQRAQETIYAHIDDLKDNPDPRYAFPIIRANQFYSDRVSEYIGFINFMIDTISGPAYPENRHYSTEFDYEVVRATVVPFLRLKYVLTAGLQLLGVRIKSGGVWDYEIFDRLLLFTTKTLDWIRTDEFFDAESPINLKQKINGFKTTIDLNDQLPQDKSLYDIFNGFMGYFGLYFRLDQNTMSLRRKIDQVYQKSINWTSKADPEYENKRQFDLGSIYEMVDDSNDNPENKLSVASFSPSTDEELPEDYFTRQLAELRPLIIGEGTKTVTLPARTLTSHVTVGKFIFDNTDFTWVLNLIMRTCRSFHIADSPDFGLAGKHSQIFFFENGLRESENPTWPNQFYIQSSNDDILADEEEASNFSLLLPGDRGIYQKWHRDFPKADEHNVISKKIRLSVQDLLQLRTWENPRRRIYHEKGEIDCLVKSVQIRITPVGLEPSIVELVKIN